MVAGCALVPALVVAGEPRHQLLGVGPTCAAYCGDEIARSVSAQRGREAAVVKNRDVAVLSCLEREAEVTGIVRLARRAQWARVGFGNVYSFLSSLIAAELMQ
jgi:hypothetical protein